MSYIRILRKIVFIFPLALFFFSCSKTESVKFTDIYDFEKVKIATQMGSSESESFREKFNNKSLTYANSTPDLLLLLDTGKVDAITGNKLYANTILKKRSDYRMFPESYGLSDYGFIFKKGSPLKNQFDEVLKKLKDSGKLQEIIDKWNGDDESIKTVPEQTWEGKNGTYECYAETFFEPFSYVKDEKIVGIDADVILNVAKELDVKINFISVDFVGVLAAVQGGKGDIGTSGISITEERKKSMDFSIPYFTDEYVFFYRDDSVNVKKSFISSMKTSFVRNFLTEARWKLILRGFGTTILISLSSLILGLLIGFGICMLRRSGNAAARNFSSGYINIIQGMPIVVLLMIFYYVMFAKINVSGILIAILGFALNFAAYSSEIIRSGLDSIDAGQTEAAMALGYTKSQSFWKVVFPQAAQRFIPVLKGQFISMVKETSVVGYIAVQDLTKASDIIRSRTMEAFFPLIITAVIYFAIANVFTSFLTSFEKVVNPQSRKNVLKGIKTVEL